MTTSVITDRREIELQHVLTDTSCKICRKVFQNSSCHLKHVRSVHFKVLKGAFYCTKCRHTFNNDEEKEIHLKQHDDGTDLKCKGCSDQFINLQSYVKHITRIHCIGRECVKCKKSFESKLEIRKHLLSLECEGFKQELSAQRKGGGDTMVTDNIHSCNHCKSCFSTCGNLKQHVMSVHKGIKRKSTGTSFVCDVCQLACRSESALKYHMVCHNGSKPFECEHCQRAFSTKGNLNVHIKRWHSGKHKMDIEKYNKVQPRVKYNSAECQESSFKLDKPVADSGKNTDDNFMYVKFKKSDLNRSLLKAAVETPLPPDEYLALYGSELKNHHLEYYLQNMETEPSLMLLANSDTQQMTTAQSIDNVTLSTSQSNENGSLTVSHPNDNVYMTTSQSNENQPVIVLPVGLNNITPTPQLINVDSPQLINVDVPLYILQPHTQFHFLSDHQNHNALTLNSIYETSSNVELTETNPVFTSLKDIDSSVIKTNSHSVSDNTRSISDKKVSPDDEIEHNVMKSDIGNTDIPVSVPNATASQTEIGRQLNTSGRQFNTSGHFITNDVNSYASNILFTKIKNTPISCIVSQPSEESSPLINDRQDTFQQANISENNNYVFDVVNPAGIDVSQQFPADSVIQIIGDISADSIASFARLEDDNILCDENKEGNHLDYTVFPWDQNENNDNSVKINDFYSDVINEQNCEYRETEGKFESCNKQNVIVELTTDKHEQQLLKIQNKYLNVPIVTPKQITSNQSESPIATEANSTQQQVIVFNNLKQQNKTTKYKQQVIVKNLPNTTLCNKDISNTILQNITPANCFDDTSNSDWFDNLKPTSSQNFHAVLKNTNEEKQCDNLLHAHTSVLKNISEGEIVENTSKMHSQTTVLKNIIGGEITDVASAMTSLGR